MQKVLLPNDTEVEVEKLYDWLTIDWYTLINWERNDEDDCVQAMDWNRIRTDDDSYRCLRSWYYIHEDDCVYVESKWEYYETDDCTYCEREDVRELSYNTWCCYKCDRDFTEDYHATIPEDNECHLYCEWCRDNELYRDDDTYCYYEEKPSRDPDINDYQGRSEGSLRYDWYTWEVIDHEVPDEIQDNIKEFYADVINSRDTIPYRYSSYHKDLWSNREEFLVENAAQVKDDIINDLRKRFDKWLRTNKKYLYELSLSRMEVTTNEAWRFMIWNRKASQVFADMWLDWKYDSTNIKIIMKRWNSFEIKESYMKNNRNTSSCQCSDNVKSYSAWYATAVTNWRLHFIMLYTESDKDEWKIKFFWRMVMRELYNQETGQWYMVPDRLYHIWWKLWNDISTIYRKVFIILQKYHDNIVVQDYSHHDSSVYNHLRLDWLEEYIEGLVSWQFRHVTAYKESYTYYHDSSTLSYYSDCEQSFDRLSRRSPVLPKGYVL